MEKAETLISKATCLKSKGQFSTTKEIIKAPTHNSTNRVCTPEIPVLPKHDRQEGHQLVISLGNLKNPYFKMKNKKGYGCISMAKNLSSIPKTKKGKYDSIKRTYEAGTVLCDRACVWQVQGPGFNLSMV